MKKIAKITITILTTVSLTTNIFTADIADTQAQVIGKEAESFPVAGNDILPGDNVLVTIRFPGGVEGLRNPADIVLSMDRTGSMKWCWDSKQVCGPGTQKMDSAKKAMKTFVDQTEADTGPGDPGDYLAVASFARDAHLQVNNTCEPANPIPNPVCGKLEYKLANMTNPNKKEAKEKIDDITIHTSDTPIGSGLYVGNEEFKVRGRAGVAKFIVLASDGGNNQHPSPTEPLAVLGGNSILDETIALGIQVFGVGIGGDTQIEYLFDEATGKYTDKGFSGTCIGCVDLNKNGRLSGEEVLKYVSCRTDPDCSMVWNTANDPAINDLDSPAHYFFAPDEAGLISLYQQIAAAIKASVSYQVLDTINTQVFRKFDKSTFKISNCATGDPWPVQNLVFLSNDTGFLVLIEPVPPGVEVCITFVAQVHELSDTVSCDVNGNGKIDPPEIGIKFSECFSGQSFKSFAVDGETRIAAVWDFDELGSCDKDGNGSLDVSEFLKCFNLMNQQPLVEIPAGQVVVINPIRPWLLTEMGNVGSKSSIEMVQPVPPNAIRDYNATFLVTARALIDPAKNFISRNDWEIQNYNTGLSSAEDYYCPDNGSNPKCPNGAPGNQNKTGYDYYQWMWDIASRRGTIKDWTDPNQIPWCGELDGCYYKYKANATFTVTKQMAKNVETDPAKSYPVVFFIPQHLQINGTRALTGGSPIIWVVGKDISSNVQPDFFVALVCKLVGEGAGCNRRGTVQRGFFFANGLFITSKPEGFTLIAGSVVANRFELQGNFGSKDPSINAKLPSEWFMYDASILWYFRNMLGEVRTIYQEVAP